MSEQEITEIFLALEDISPLRRSKALEELRVSVKENHGHLLFGNVKRVFSVLKARLRDSNWNVAHQSIQFLGDLFRIQDLGPDCKSCLSIILPTLVESIGDTKIVIRKASLQVLKELLVHSDSVGLVVETFLRSGLENDDWRVRQESVQALASVVQCARDAAGVVDTPAVVDALVSRLRDPSMVVVQAAEESIFALQAQMGEDAVQAAVKRMGASKQQLFAEHQKNIMKNSGSNFMITPAADTLLQFGFIPINVLNQLRDSASWKVRASGIEELERLVSGLRNVSPVIPHLPALMDFLAGLLSDQNFKISLTTIHILGTMVSKFGAHLESPVASILPPLVNKLGDNKIVVRQGIMKFMNALISVVNPDAVLSTLLDSYDANSARVREEVMNIVTVAMLTASEHAFNYAALLAPVCRCLNDSKPKVRDAAMDAMAVIHSRIGTGEMNALLSPTLVDEETYRRLQAQFASGTLPKLSAEGLVLHVAQGGGHGLTVDLADDVSRSRHTTPASRSSVTPGTTPTAQRKLPWDLPSSRSGSRQSSAASARMSPPKAKEEDVRGPWQGDIPEWDQNLAYERRVYTRGEEDQNQRYQHQHQHQHQHPHPHQHQQHEYSPQYQQQNSPTAAHHPQYHYQRQQGQQHQHHHQYYQQHAQQRQPQQQYYQPEYHHQHYQQGGGHASQTQWQQNDGYQTLIQPEYDDQEDCWWDKGDAPAMGDLMDPPSPMRPGDSPTGGYRSVQMLHGNSPGSGIGSPTSPNSAHSPRAFWQEGVVDSAAPTAHPTALPLQLRAAEYRESSLSISPRKDDKVRLWLPDAVPAESNERMPTGSAYGGSTAENIPARNNSDERVPTGSGYGNRKPPAAEERMPTGAGYVDDPEARADDLPWWEKAEQAEIVGSPHRRRRRAVEERGQVGSAPVSAPSSASSSRAAADTGSGYNGGYDDKLGLLQHSTPTRSRRDLSSASSSVSSQGGAPRHGRREGSANRRPGILKRSPPANQPDSEEPRSPVRSGAGKSAIDIGTRPVELLSTEDLAPMEASVQVARSVAQKLKSDDWSVMYEGIDEVRRLAKHHPETISSISSELGASLLHLAQNLRSQVSRNALLGLHDMFLFLKKQMDGVIDTAVPVLMKRACETNGFICEASDNALHAMVCNAGPRPAMVALLAGGNSRNAQLRTKAALHLETLIDQEGNKLIQFRETDRLFPGLATFAQDSSPECRAYGKRGLYKLSRLYNVAEFERKCSALISPEAACRKALEVAAQGRAQGVESFGGTSASFGPRASQLNETGKRGQVGRLTASAGACPGKGVPSATAATDGAEESLQALTVHGDGRDKGRNLRRVPRKSVSTATRATKEIPELEAMEQLYASMSASDWRVRHAAVADLVDLVLKYPIECGPKLQTIFDHLTLRMADGNSKVLLLALSSLERMVPVLKDSLEVVLNTLVPVLSQQIGSANASVRNTTMNVLDSLIDNVDNTSLVQYFANVIAFGNPRAKAAMVEKTAAIVPTVYRQKPQLITKHVLPRAVRLVEDPDGAMRTACTSLLVALAAELGVKGLEATDMTDEQRRRVMAAVQGTAGYHRTQPLRNAR